MFINAKIGQHTANDKLPCSLSINFLLPHREINANVLLSMVQKVVSIVGKIGLEKFSFTECSGNLVFVPGLDRLKGRYVVWWYNGIKPTLRKGSDATRLTAPSVTVVFREICDDSMLGSVQYADIKLPYLTLLRIGTVIENSRVVGMSSCLSSFTTVLDQTQGCYQLINDVVNRKYDFNQYQILRYDNSWFLEFPVSNGKIVLIPCLIYFMYCYGFSAELKRVLTTYPWDGVKTRICGPTESFPRRRGWPVNVPKRLRDDDATFIAHVMHDPVAEREAKHIGAQLLVGFPGLENKPISLKVRPWTREPLEAELLGVWLDEFTFLGLTFTGISEPRGEDILLSRENNSLTKEKADGNLGRAWSGALKPISRYPLLVVHSDYDPDPNEPPVEVSEPPLKILGVRRTRIKIRKDRANSTSGTKRIKELKGRAASGELSSGEHGVSPISINPDLIDSDSDTLLAMWSAALQIKAKFPSIIQLVEWYSLKNNEFLTDSPPGLIALDPYTSKKLKTVSAENLRFLRIHGPESLRGFLLIRILIRGEFYFVVEIERKVVSGKEQDKYQGLVFTIPNTASIWETVKKLKVAILDSCGVMERVSPALPTARYFKHPTAPSRLVSCQRGLINGLEKIGVENWIIKVLNKEWVKRLKYKNKIFYS